MVNSAPIDPQATSPTKALYQGLRALRGRATLFGHQDDLAYGNTWWATDGRSDVRDVAGSHPAVLGFDLGRMETGSPTNLDGVEFANMRRWIRRGHEMGAVITLSWHSVNPHTGGGYGANTSPHAIAEVLPGGRDHAVLIDWLDKVAAFIGSLVDRGGEPIPIVFRPYHEHSGHWFWWGVGKGLNPVDEFVALWRFTVDHLVGKRGLHNLLWAISPDRSALGIECLAEEYLAIYPGDDYVDILGIDNYWDVRPLDDGDSPDQRHTDYVRVLETLSVLADGHGKLAAQTETAAFGDHRRPWTAFLLTALTASDLTRDILWSLVWRNPVGEPGGAPHPGSPSAEDFVAFARDAFVAFADDLPDLYQRSPGH